jgi:hypothetical protein
MGLIRTKQDLLNALNPRAVEAFQVMVTSLNEYYNRQTPGYDPEYVVTQAQAFVNSLDNK